MDNRNRPSRGIRSLAKQNQSENEEIFQAFVLFDIVRNRQCTTKCSMIWRVECSKKLEIAPSKFYRLAPPSEISWIRCPCIKHCPQCLFYTRPRFYLPKRREETPMIHLDMKTSRYTEYHDAGALLKCTIPITNDQYASHNPWDSCLPSMSIRRGFQWDEYRTGKYYGKKPRCALVFHKRKCYKKIKFGRKTWFVTLKLEGRTGKWTALNQIESGRKIIHWKVLSWDKSLRTQACL